MPSKPLTRRGRSQSPSNNRTVPSWSRLTIRGVEFPRACLNRCFDRRNPADPAGLALDSTNASRSWRPIAGRFSFEVRQGKGLKFGLSFRCLAHPKVVKKISLRLQPCHPSPQVSSLKSWISEEIMDTRPSLLLVDDDAE